MTGASPKQHHFVPRFYLERFTDPKGHVWTFDKSTDKVFATSPSKLARESGFYEAPTLGNEIDQTVMEDMLSALGVRPSNRRDNYMLSCCATMSVAALGDGRAGVPWAIEPEKGISLPFIHRGDTA